MLQLSGSLLNKPILSLRSGGPVARATTPIFNPSNLKIEGFYCIDNISKATLVLVCQDIRELSSQGFIINDHDVLAHPEDLVRLKAILRWDFELTGKPVETISQERLGKITDYAVETASMYVQKLYVAPSFLKSLTSGTLSIDRTLIVEVTDQRILIQDLLQPTPTPVPAAIS